MKTILPILATLVVSISLIQARVPSGAFKAAEYDEALAEAKESGKPIAVVVTDTASSCPKCEAGNEAVFKGMRSDYVLVVQDDAVKGDALPEGVKQKTYEIYRKKGNIIPIVTVLSPESQAVLGGLCYNQIAKDGRKAFRNLEEEVEKAKAELPAEPAKEEEPKNGEEPEIAEACKVGEMREWTNSDGRTIKAAVLAVNATNVTFKLEGGKVVDYPLTKLSEESRKLAKEACE